MERHGYETARFGNALSFFDRIAFFDRKSRRSADVLTDGNHIFVKERSDSQFFSGGQFFSFERMNTALEIRGLYAHAAPSFFLMPSRTA